MKLVRPSPPSPSCSFRSRPGCLRCNGEGPGIQPLLHEQSVPSEFYWSRLQYNTLYGGGGFRSSRRLGAGLSEGRQRLPDCAAPFDPHQFTLAAERCRLDSDHLFDYPWVYAINVESWTFTDEEAKRLHDYLLKGGFLMVDHFHGAADWTRFMAGMRQVLPDAQVEDLPDGDEIYHVLYDINEKFQIPGEQYVSSGITYEKDGYVPKWRAIRDRHGRIMVAICHNMHLGDAWEHADEAEYPEKFSGLAFRIVLNYITYSMTH